MLSPSINLTVLPPSTFSAVLPLATTFHADKSLTCCLPASVKLLRSVFAALLILLAVASSNLTVTSSPLASVTIPFCPLILNFTSPVLKDFASVEPVLPPKEILRPIASVFLSILALLAAISPAFLVMAALLSAIFCLFVEILSLLVAISAAFLSIAALLSAIFCLLSAMASAFLPILAVLSAILALFSAT